MKPIILLLNILFFTSNTPSVFAAGFIDTVYSVTYGRGNQVFGRDSLYFPNNIFGPPASYASKYTPANQESDVCSIGLGGEIIIGRKGHYIIDKPGIDFIIFENVFATTNGAKVFAEPAIVSVSKDGVNYVDFPYNSETLEGLAGVHWTNGEKNPFDYDVSGGDGFDLATIGIDSIMYIKIKDTAMIVTSLPTSSKYFSPAGMITGFDLDAVALINIIPIDDNMEMLSIDYNYGGVTIRPNFPNISITTYDILGNRMQCYNESFTIQKQFRNTILIIMAEKNGNTEYHKVISR